MREISGPGAWKCTEGGQAVGTRKPKYINRLVPRVNRLVLHVNLGYSKNKKNQGHNVKLLHPLYKKGDSQHVDKVEEWRNVTNAFRALRNDTSVSPNVFAAFAGLHTGEFNQVAHSGGGFTGVHRILLKKMEEALQVHNPFVCLPYWDSSLDEEYSRRYFYEYTSIWSNTYFGTPVGSVISGPFAGFTGPSGYPLNRQAGYDGELMTTTDYTNIMSGTSYYSLVYTSQPTSYTRNLEYQHGSPHVYVGGTMSQLSTAAYEPVFWFHHCYIDKLFQDFRNKLRNLSASYPGNPASYRHAASYPIGIGNYTQADGYLTDWDSLVTYEPVPRTCNSTNTYCGNRSLVCQGGRCLPTRLGITKRSAPEPDKLVNGNKPRDFGAPIQNDFCIDNQCDSD
ncbi:hypothetical protein Btru_051309 [Bulinus truncatus]|nr:hypothetical protein Btru_051309 [Bulinus truncatus]